MEVLVHPTISVILFVLLILHVSKTNRKRAIRAVKTSKQTSHAMWLRRTVLQPDASTKAPLVVKTCRIKSTNKMTLIVECTSTSRVKVEESMINYYVH